MITPVSNIITDKFHRDNFQRVLHMPGKLVHLLMITYRMKIQELGWTSSHQEEHRPQRTVQDVFAGSWCQTDEGIHGSRTRTQLTAGLLIDAAVCSVFR